MNKDIFKKGISLITSVFNNIHIEAKIYYELLKDLTDEQFEFAIHSIINNVTELYPNSNLVALIRKQVNELNSVSATSAWAIVLDKVNNNTPIKDKNVEKVLKLIGGVYAVGHSTNIDYLRGQFFTMYNDLVKENKKEINHGQIRFNFQETKTITN
jgi:hypothetical protein